MKAYLDTNAIQGAIRLFPSASTLEDALAGADFELSLGSHVMYELARAFTSPASRDATSQCLSVLAEMERIHYVPQPQALIDGEVLQLHVGGRVLQRPSVGYAAAMRSELYMLSRGHTQDAERFIAKRDEEVKVATCGSRRRTER